MFQICCKLLSETAKAPSKSKDPLDAGYDLFTPSGFWMGPGCRVFVPTSVIAWVEWREGDGSGPLPLPTWVNWYLRLADKSGLARRHGITVLGGVVDRTYCGPNDELGVVLFNSGDSTVSFAAGDAICQIVPTLVPVMANMVAIVVSSAPSLVDRGGFGSSART